MPATPRIVRASALALAGLGLTASTMSALPADAAPSGSTSDNASTTTTAKKTQRTAPVSAKRRVANRVLTARNIALAQRGDSYAYGAAGPASFDCSGLIRYAYSRAGIAVPRTSSAQAGAARRIAKKDLRPGDLMFFYGNGGIYHAAIFLRWTRGHALMVHSPRPGSRVHVAAPWTSSWFAGTLRRA